MMASPPAGPAGPAGRILGPGSRGERVRRLQRQLEQLGLTLDDRDGLYGSGTEAAVRAFQTRRPWWPQDGLVDEALGQALAQAVQEGEGEAALRELAAADQGLPPGQLRRRPALVAAVQRRLRGLGLHPGGSAIDGVSGPLLLQALGRFRRLARLGAAAIEGLDPSTAAALLTIDWLPEVRERWSPAVARRRFAAEARRIGADDHQLAFLDRGLQSSPWLESLAAAELPAPARRRQVPTADGPGWSAYPRRGLVPALETDGLEWLGPEIAQACLCRGRNGPSGLEVHWQGRDALTPTECLSATKIIPLLNVLARAATDGARLQPWGSDALSLALKPTLFDLVSYAGTVGSSNALAALLNQLEPHREVWIREHTGGAEGLRFGGRYGETPPIARPELRHAGDNKLLLPFGSPAAAGNAVSVYNLTRLLSMLGWHRLLGPAQRLRGLRGAGAGLAARVLCCDSARYLDAAFADLGLERRIDTPLILSKMGYGPSALVYTAFLHVRDRRGDQPIEHSLAFTLRCPKGNGDREAVRADLAMAEAVTSLLAQTLDGNG